MSFPAHPASDASHPVCPASVRSHAPSGPGPIAHTRISGLVDAHASRDPTTQSHPTLPEWPSSSRRSCPVPASHTHSLPEPCPPINWPSHTANAWTEPMHPPIRMTRSSSSVARLYTAIDPSADPLHILPSH